jgi:hypothetical protein
LFSFSLLALVEVLTVFTWMVFLVIEARINPAVFALHYGGFYTANKTISTIRDPTPSETRILQLFVHSKATNTKIELVCSKHPAVLGQLSNAIDPVHMMLKQNAYLLAANAGNRFLCRRVQVIGANIVRPAKNAC